MSATLLLSKSYEPIKVISWQRALTLLTLGKIEVLENHDREVRSPTVVMKMPAVVRLVNAFKRPKNQRVKFNRLNVFARDNYKCQYCAKKFRIDELTFDHVVPKSHGGPTTWENVASSCYQCNLKKGSRTPEQAYMKLLKKPVEPRFCSALAFNIPGKTIHNSWQQYIRLTGEIDAQ